MRAVASSARRHSRLRASRPLHLAREIVEDAAGLRQLVVEHREEFRGRRATFARERIRGERRPFEEGVVVVVPSVVEAPAAPLVVEPKLLGPGLEVVREPGALGRGERGPAPAERRMASPNSRKLSKRTLNPSISAFSKNTRLSRAPRHPSSRLVGRSTSRRASRRWRRARARRASSSDGRGEARWAWPPRRSRRDPHGQVAARAVVTALSDATQPRDSVARGQLSRAAARAARSSRPLRGRRGRRWSRSRGSC